MKKPASAKPAHFQIEPSGSTHIITQFAARSGAHKTWERSATEAVKTPGSSITTLIPAARESYSPAPTHSTPQPRTRSGAKSGEREANLGYFWAKPWMPTRAAHRFTESLTSLVTSLGQSKHLRATEPYWIWLSGLLLQKLGSRSCPWQGCDSYRVKRPCPTSVQSLDTATPVVTPIKGITANIAWERMWLTSTSKTALPTKILE